jgi:hypothetical protein
VTVAIVALRVAHVLALRGSPWFTIQVSDMEVVGMGATIPLTDDCVRTP